MAVNVGQRNVPDTIRDHKWFRSQGFPCWIKQIMEKPCVKRQFVHAVTAYG